MNNPRLARQGERLAAEFLQGQGLVVKEKNFRCPLGEVDIILWDDEILVFCEVKTRKNLEYGHPLEAITTRKLGKVTKVAQYYINNQNIENYRIDAVGIHFQDGNPNIEWIKNCTI